MTETTSSSLPSDRAASPAEVQQAYDTRPLPPQLFRVINELLTKNARHGYATILQKDIVQELKALGFSSESINKDRLLDFEPHYRNAGWKVTYDKPGYNESYEAKYMFENEQRMR